MTDPANHPSYLELDRQCVGVSGDPATAWHVAECERCAAYVSSYQPMTDLPDWVRFAEDQRGRGVPRSVPWYRPRSYALGGGLILAAASCLALLLPHERAQKAYDGVKGMPAAIVYVQHADQVTIWSGDPLSQGDRIRLEVSPENFDHVSVFNVQTGAPPVRLYTGRLTPHLRGMLPKAWELDASPHPEELVVMLAHAEISASAATTLLRAHDPADVWIVRLTLPKRETRQ